MQDELKEVFVDYKNGFTELLKPASRSLKDYMHELQVELPKGYCTEINLQAIDWLKEVAFVLKTGFVLTIDYGFTAAELFSAKRSSGTILCYHQQKINTYPYRNIGEQDITSHVNFSALYQWGLKTGLEC
jgi:SAM-dependent MidA family methyltransferase